MTEKNATSDAMDDAWGHCKDGVIRGRPGVSDLELQAIKSFFFAGLVAGSEIAYEKIAAAPLTEAVVMRTFSLEARAAAKRQLEKLVGMSRNKDRESR